MTCDKQEGLLVKNQSLYVLKSSVRCRLSELGFIFRQSRQLEIYLLLPIVLAPKKDQQRCGALVRKGECRPYKNGSESLDDFEKRWKWPFETRCSPLRKHTSTSRKWKRPGDKNSWSTCLPRQCRREQREIWFSSSREREAWAEKKSMNINQNESYYRQDKCFEKRRKDVQWPQLVVCVTKEHVYRSSKAFAWHQLEYNKLNVAHGKEKASSMSLS